MFFVCYYVSILQYVHFVICVFFILEKYVCKYEFMLHIIQSIIKNCRANKKSRETNKNKRKVEKIK